MPTNSGSCSPPRCVADALGLGSLADADQGLDPEVLRALYRHARNEDGQRVLFTNDASFTKGWINLESSRIRELLAALIDLDDIDDLKKARHVTKANLMAAPWNDVLGIEEPPIRCQIKIHGTKWGLRFEDATPCRRGMEILNEALPPISENPDGGAPQPNPAPMPTSNSPAAATPPADVVPNSSASAPGAVVDALARGGLM